MANYFNSKDLWLKIGCFLTGYNFSILNESSESSKKYIKKITSALIIIISIWSMIGYLFAIRYAGANNLTALFSAFISGLLIIQIERQIILGGKVKKSTIIFRLLLGLIVAIIGALILDQVFFKNDIAKRKEDLLNSRIEQRIDQVKNNILRNVLFYQRNIDSIRLKIESNEIIARREGYKIKLSDSKRVQEISEDPNKVKADGNVSQNSLTKLTTQSSVYGIHPKLIENDQLRIQINSYETLQKTENDSLLVQIDKAKVSARNEPPGFLDELTIIVELASQSKIALFAYLLFLSFFIFIELFIVLAKLNDGDNDYHRLVQYQEKIREERLFILEQKRTSAIGEEIKIESSNNFLANRPN